MPVGTLVGAQGLRGELRLNPASDFPERVTEPGLAGCKQMEQTRKKWSCLI